MVFGPLKEDEIDKITDFTYKLYQWASGRDEKLGAIERLTKQYARISKLLLQGDVNIESAFRMADPQAEFLEPYGKTMHSVDMKRRDWVTRKDDESILVMSTASFAEGLKRFESKMAGTEEGNGISREDMRRAVVQEVENNAYTRLQIETEESFPVIAKFNEADQSLKLNLTMAVADNPRQKNIREGMKNPLSKLAAAIAFQKHGSDENRKFFGLFLSVKRIDDNGDIPTVPQALAGVEQALHADRNIGDHLRDEIMRTMRRRVVELGASPDVSQPPPRYN